MLMEWVDERMIVDRMQREDGQEYLNFCYSWRNPDGLNVTDCNLPTDITECYQFVL